MPRELDSYTCSAHSGVTANGHMEMTSDLVPQSDLPGVPARDACGEQPLHVAQEHHPVHPVVLTTGLLEDTRMKCED